MQKQESTILSVELSGLQSLTENLTSEEITLLMNDLHSMFDITIRMHHGIVSSFSGESILSAFQQNKSSKLSALHAVDFAFEFNDQFQSYIKEKQLDNRLRLKMGVASGSVVSTEIGTPDKKHITIIGEAVNNSGRICQFAGEGQILIDASTYEAVTGYYKFQTLEPIPLKGGIETLPIFELSEKKRRKLDLKISGERKVVSEMVGRSSEMEQLENLFKQLIAGKGSIINIIGKAGIGKSRLMAEIKVQPIMEKVVLLEGRALSTGQNLSFHPITNLIKSWAEISEEDVPTASSEKLQNGIKQIALDQSDEIYAFLATMMGLPLEGKYKERMQGIEGEALEKLILKNLRDLIISATKDKPRIYLIEDMHWADSSSITMFESLYKLSQNYPVMFINVMRPGYKDTSDYILKYQVDNFPGDHFIINVNPLEETESGNLIRNLLRKTKLPDEMHKMIISKTEGNPFFIEEIIRSFIDEGIIEVKDGDFVVTEKIHEVNIPETINDVILSRVDKLDEKTRELLNTASVMGRNFYYKVLEEATDTIEELDDRLSYLTEVQLISESKKKEEIEYLFKHALAQQATYESIVMENKKDLHLKIARSIEKVFADKINEFYGTLAYHYTKAENKEKTIQYLILAGDESMKSGASSEALNFYLDALELLPQKRKLDSSDKQILDLRYKIAMSYHTLGKNAIAVEHYEAIMKMYFNFSFARTEKGILLNGILSMVIFRFIINNQYLFFKRKMKPDLDILMKLFSNWGFAYLHLNPKHFALKGFKALVYSSFYDIHRSLPALSIFVDLAVLFNFTGISISTAQKMIDLSQRAGVENNPQSYMNYRMMRLIQHYFTGRWRAEDDFEETYQKGLRIGKYWSTLTYIYYSGMCSIESGNYKDFLSKFELLNELAETLDITYAVILKYRLINMGYLKFRKLNELGEISDTSIEFIKTTSDNANLFMVYCMRAQGCVYVGRTDEAEHALKLVTDKLDRHKRVPIFYSQYLLSKLEYKFKRLEESKEESKTYFSTLKEISQVLKIFVVESKKNPASLTLAYLFNVRLLKLQKKPAKAFKYLKKALIAGEMYDGRPDLSRAYFETGKFLSDQDVKYKELNGKSANHYLENAKSMFEEMDLQWDLDEYRKFINN